MTAVAPGREEIAQVLNDNRRARRGYSPQSIKYCKDAERNALLSDADALLASGFRLAAKPADEGVLEAEWIKICDDLGCAYDNDSLLVAIDNLKQRASGFDGGLLQAATRMRDILTSDGEPPSVIVPEDIDANDFTQAFDNLATAIRAASK